MTTIGKEMARIRQEFIEQQKKAAARQSVPTGVFGRVQPPQGASAATGGTVKREGLVKLHRKERIIPANKSVGGMSLNTTINVDARGSSDPKQTTEEIKKTIPLINDELRREVRRIVSTEMGRGTLRREGMEGTA